MPVALALLLRLPSGAGHADPLPPPEQAMPLGEGGLATAIFAGGCFWGMEAVFEELRGVREVITGYAGGEARTARYGPVSAGLTDHAEGVRITYDPELVRYGQLLQVFFSVAHDPTQHNRQGPDVGPQYRSAIFTTDPQRRRVATAYIRQLDATDRLAGPIVTRIEASERFFPAEPHHQDFVRRNPRHPYVVHHDLPKLERLRATFPELLE